MKFPIAIEPGDETTAFGVVVPDLPGCFSAGDTLEAAYANAAEAIELWIETALDTGKPFPHRAVRHGIRAIPIWRVGPGAWWRSICPGSTTRLNTSM